MKDLTLLKSLTEDEYNQLLRQAVAVIEASRIQIAKQLNTVANNSVSQTLRSTFAIYAICINGFFFSLNPKPLAHCAVL